MSHAEHKALVKAHQEAHPDQPKAMNIPAILLKKLVDHPKAEGVRAYFTRENGKLGLLLTAHDAEGNDIPGQVLGSIPYCPPDCRGTQNLF